VGSTDASDEPALGARFGAHGLALRVARGRSLGGSLPAAALRAARDLLGAGSVEALSAFVRHPEVDRALGRAGVFFPADKLDRSLSKSPSQAAVTAARVAEPELAAAVEKLLQPLTARDGAREGVPRFLASLFGGAPPVSNDARAMNALVDVARAIGDAPRGLAVHTTPAEHLTLVLDALGDAAVPSPADEAAVELLGFLELPLAEAEILLVTGVAEGRLPTRTADDPFLPEPLRRSLGLADAARTFARDAHALLAVVAGHREAHVIVPRTSAAGDALLVSRLVLADHADVVAKRLLAAYEPRPPVVLVARGGASTTGFGVPALPPLAERPTTLSVTAFRDYLADPYRFALRHLFRLSVVETDPPELTPSSFGTLVHAVLADFGVSTVKDADDPEAIAAFCAERLDHHLLAMTFGAPTAAARIQTEQARARLLSFAVAQAAHRRSGFRIDRVEQQVETPDALTGITLVGRIDRIDRHEDGRVLLLDYKTHDRAATPEAQHRKRGEWVDLQLPLYRHLARALGYEGEPLLGYASLPRDRAVFSLATWSDEELASADEVAQLVVDKILHDPLPRYPVSPPPAYSEAFAGICRDGTLSDEGDDDGDAAGEGDA
jgi:RecB family exonuclease